MLLPQFIRRQSAGIEKKLQTYFAVTDSLDGDDND